MVGNEEDTHAAESKYSESQTQTQSELTQLTEDAGDEFIPEIQSPLTLPWGRLLRSSRNCEPEIAVAQKVIDSNEGTTVSTTSGGVDLFPRHPSSESRISKASNTNIPNHLSDSQQKQQEKTLKFLGLEGLRPSDRFNEYVIGRSLKCDIISSKGVKPFISNQDEESNQELKKTYDWAHSCISNRHCHIFCMLKHGAFNHFDTCSLRTENTSAQDASDLVEMDVYLEDSSGNGTVINNRILLRRGEKRLLHTGDEISLINPAILRKRISSVEHQRQVILHYSYIFVNVHQQQGVGQIRPVERAGIPDMKEITSAIVPQQQNNNNMAPPHIKTDSQKQKKQSSNKPHVRRIEEYYDLRDKLGSGTTGEVRRAIHRESGVQRAVKIIAMSANGRMNTDIRMQETLKTLKAEASILQSVDHPYIVKLIDLFVSHTAVYLVMEMLHGGDLFDRIVSKGKYTEIDSRRIMRRILNAVHYLHEERDVVHRDLKPENILCVNQCSDIDIKLTDFGLAKTITEDGLKTFCGTPLYFAPEVLRRRHTIAGRGRYGKEADMWSLGIILYVLLCGAPPFDPRDSIDAVANAKIQFQGEKWADVSTEAKQFVRGLLTANPADRINIRQACQHNWILIDDGDTHTNPLDDGATKSMLKTKKKDRNASRSNLSSQINIKSQNLITNSTDMNNDTPTESSPSVGKKQEKSISANAKPSLQLGSDSKSAIKELRNITSGESYTHKVSNKISAPKYQPTETRTTPTNNELESTKISDTRIDKKVRKINLLSSPETTGRKSKVRKKSAGITQTSGQLELSDDKIESDFSDEENDIKPGNI